MTSGQARDMQKLPPPAGAPPRSPAGARSEEVAVHGAPLELVLLAQHRQAVADGLLDLGLEARVLREHRVVGLGAELRVLLHVLDLLAGGPARAHETRGTRRQLRELVDVVAHVLTLVEHIHHLLDLSKLGTHCGLVQVGLNNGRELLKLSLPEGAAVDQVQVVGPVCAHDRGVVLVQLLQHVVARVIGRGDVRPRGGCDKGGLRPGRGCPAKEGQRQRRARSPRAPQGPRHPGGGYAARA
mmetsp:Transcript_41293/g.123419  ORF Transcript_41293/g.123419 Transcript_41293/m.123419 type:complete len:241 (-) Transcript_41293:64-786(-)